MPESDCADVQLSEAAKAIFETCFTLAPITFQEAKRLGTLHYHRALAAAKRARDCLGRLDPPPGQLS